LAREVELIQACDVGADIFSLGLVHTRRTPLQVDVDGGDVLASAGAPQRSDGVVAEFVVSGSITGDVDEVDVGDFDWSGAGSESEAQWSTIVKSTGRAVERGCAELTIGRVVLTPLRVAIVVVCFCECRGAD
jgi:hypothetical protein